jgi:hypothetical protein
MHLPDYQLSRFGTHPTRKTSEPRFWDGKRDWLSATLGPFTVVRSTVLYSADFGTLPQSNQIPLKRPREASQFGVSPALLAVDFSPRADIAQGG